MSDQEKFLTRWSRRKRDTASDNARADRPAAADDSATQEMKSDQSIAARPPEAEVQPAQEFDLTKLPSLESIGADSDITAFFQPGVPLALRRAALRRAWSADPAIRDFIGLNENFWDAAGPDGIAGFGELDPGFDVKRMVAELFGETKPESKEPNTSIDQVPVAENSADSGLTPVPAEKAVSAVENSSHRDGNAAAQQDFA